MGKTQTTPKFYCENAEIPITEDFEELGVMIDDKLKFEKYVGKVCRKVSEQFAFLKCKKKMLHFETRKNIYFAFILSISILPLRPSPSAVKVLVQNLKK